MGRKKQWEIAMEYSVLKVGFPSRQTMRILDLYTDHCRITPGNSAILAPDMNIMTYGSLFEHVIRNATTLRELGIKRNERVAIVMPNGPEMITAFLAVTAVATCAPLNPAYSLEEFKIYLTDVNAKAVIVRAGLATNAVDAACELGITLITLIPKADGEAGAFEFILREHTQVADLELADSDDVALVLHTSGTTGRPKIVALTHRNIHTSAVNIASSLALSPEDICLNVMPLFHVHGLIGAVLASFAAGGGVISTSGFDTNKFFAWLEDYSPTWYTAVPTLHQAVVSQGEKQDNRNFKHKLRFIRSSSSALPPIIGQKLENLFLAPVIEAYGMTEASHQIAVNPLPPGKRKPGSVGKAAGCQVSIMDAGGNQLLPGITGEIVVCGENVIQGYEISSETSQQSFHEGWFRTGDQGYIDEDGYVFINGRIKEIINRGGENISPREIDEVLLRHPAVQQAVTFAIPHPTVNEVAGAIVVLHKQMNVSERDLRQFAAEHLAYFKVPTIIVFAEDIPKGPTGKIQRVGLEQKLDITLPEADNAASESDDGPDRPEEQMIAAFWLEVFAFPKIGINDDFFAVGGNSIQAMQIIARIREKTGVELQFAEFFNAPTILELAALVKKRNTGNN